MANWGGRLMNPFVRVALACLFLCAPRFVLASGTDISDATPSFSLQGFGTLGMTRGNDKNAQFVRDLSQPNGADTAWTAKVDSVLGLQANVQFSPQTEGVLQVVSRYHYDGSYNPEVTWAFLRHDFSPDFSLRAGRLGTEFYMLGDSRLVGYSNLTVRPQPDFYGSLVFSYIDGLDVSGTFPVANGLLRGKLYAGRSPEETPYDNGIVWDLSGSLLVGGYLDYLTGPWQVRVSHAQVRFKNEIPIVEWLNSLNILFPSNPLVPEMWMADTWARFDSIGVVYDEGPLNIQLMLNQTTQESLTYQDTKAGYVLAAYRFGEVTPYLGFSRSISTAKPIPSSPIADPTGDFVDGIAASLAHFSHIDQHTFTLGGRWDVQKNLALKAQVDWIRGKPTSTFLFKKADRAGWDGNMTVYSLALDFVF